MSDARPGTIPTVQRHTAVDHQVGEIPVRVQCFRCPNKVLKYVKIHTLYAYKRGDPRIMRDGTDRIVRTQYWCLNCFRGANVEEDDSRTVPSINVS